MKKTISRKRGQYSHCIDPLSLYLHENTVGRQILTMFLIDQVVMFKDSDIAGIAELLTAKAGK